MCATEVTFVLFHESCEAYSMDVVMSILRTGPNEPDLLTKVRTNRPDHITCMQSRD